MKSELPNTALNEDKEIWRKVKDDYYSPSIHVTKGGGIGINVGGYVIVKPVEDWHKLAHSELAPTLSEEELLTMMPEELDKNYTDTEYANGYNQALQEISKALAGKLRKSRKVGRERLVDIMLSTAKTSVLSPYGKLILKMADEILKEVNYE